MLFSSQYKLAGMVIEVASDHLSYLSILDEILKHMEISTKTLPDHRLVFCRVEKRDNDTEQDMFPLLLDGKRIGIVDNKDVLIQMILLTLEEVCCREKEWFAMFHAGAIAHGETCILLPGQADSGKSTLIAGMQFEGWTYLGDNLALIDQNGTLQPVPLAQRIKTSRQAILRGRVLELDDAPETEYLGQRVAHLPPLKHDMNAWQQQWPVSAIVFPRYEAGLELRFDRLAKREVIRTLAESNSVFGEQSLPDLVAWVNSRPAYVLEFGDLDEGVVMLNSLLGSTLEVPAADAGSQNRQIDKPPVNSLSAESPQEYAGQLQQEREPGWSSRH